MDQLAANPSPPPNIVKGVLVGSSCMTSRTSQWIGGGLSILGVVATLALVSEVWLAPVLATIGLVILVLSTRSVAQPGPRTDRRLQPRADGGDPGIELVTAIIRPAKLTPVKRALAEASAPSLTVTNVSGRGTQPTETGEWHGDEYIVDLHQKVKVECAVEDEKTEAVVDAIQSAARTGEPGDGKIFVQPISDAVRVSTGERGIEAM